MPEIYLTPYWDVEPQDNNKEVQIYRVLKQDAATNSRNKDDH